MSDGPSRFDPEKDFLRKPEFKIKEGSASIQPEIAVGSSSALAPLSDSANVVAKNAESKAESNKDLIANSNLDRLGQPFAPSLPTAPKYGGLPYPTTLTILVIAIVSMCSWLEPMRAAAVVNILDMKGVNAPDFVDAHINLAEVYYRNGAHSAANDSVQKALAIVTASNPVDKEKEVALLLRLAQSQYDGKFREEATRTIDRALLMLNEKNIPTVNISVCWQLDGLANTIIKEEGRRRVMRALAIRIWQKGIQYFRSPNPVLVANLYSNMGYAQMDDRQYTNAAASFMQFHRLTEIRGDRTWRVERLRQAAYCYSCVDDWVNTQKAATMAIDMCQRLGPPANSELAYSRYFLWQAENHLGLSRAGVEHLNL